MSEGVQRRLAAIVAADVVGYSRLMGADEIGTLDVLRAHRSELIDPLIEKHGGRIVKTTGDGLLLEFPSVVAAVECAIATQKGMAERNAGISDDEAVRFRVGVHLGDVIVEGDDIFGDGVNVAARLEGLSEADGLALSDDAYRQVRDRLDIDWRDSGEHKVKNIARPLHVWRWSPTASQVVETVSTEGQVLALPDIPSIAVLPFDNMSEDPEQGYFADGLVEDVITALSRSRDLFVVARNSSFTYRGKAVDVRTVGKELGVRFVLEGSVRRAGDRMRITVQLIEAGSGTHIWAEKYDRPVTDIFEVQDEITINVSGAVGSEIRTTNMRASASKSAKDLQSWERLMKAWWHVFRTNPDDNRKGQEICRQEIDANGGTAGFHSALVMGCCHELIWGFGNRPPRDVINEGMRAGRTAIELDPSDDAAHSSLGFLLCVSGDHDAAVREANAAIDINPNAIWGHAMLGLALAYSGPENYDGAMKAVQHAIRLGPRDLGKHWLYTHMAAASFVSEKFTDTIEFARTAIQLDPTNGTAHRYLTAALAREGQIEAAKEAWTRSCEVQPLNLSDYARSLYRMFKRDDDAGQFLEALQLAGAPVE